MVHENQSEMSWMCAVVQSVNHLNHIKQELSLEPLHHITDHLPFYIHKMSLLSLYPFVCFQG